MFQDFSLKVDRLFRYPAQIQTTFDPIEKYHEQNQGGKPSTLKLFSKIAIVKDLQKISPDIRDRI
jgi:hypothetical protein